MPIFSIIQCNQSINSFGVFMTIKVIIAAVVLSGLFILSGCSCPCSSEAATCPMPGSVASSTQTCTIQ